MMEPTSPRLNGRLGLRFEDVTQEGRVRLEALPVALSVVWDALLSSPSAREDLLQQGVLPILTRLTVEGTPGPFAIDHPLAVEGGFALSHQASEAGEVQRLLLDMEVALRGPKGRTNLPPPDDAGALALAGTVRAEHVFTRPFAPPGERKVVALELGGEQFVPPARRVWREPATVLEVPPEAVALESAFSEDPLPLVLGPTHTDSNQHVNSLVYPRLFEEAALRRLVALGREANVLARSLEIGFRRPTFAGEQLRIFLRTFELGERVMCVGAFFAQGEAREDLSKARVFVRMVLEP